MNKLIIFNETCQSVRKSQQTIHIKIAMIRLQLFSSRKLTDSNDPFRAVFLQWTELTSKETGDLVSARTRRRATAAAKSKLLMSNFRIIYCNWK